MQERIRNGNVEDIFPYRRKKRFVREIPSKKFDDVYALP
jgi:isocitrate dehydrogenase kinase/phosphatase